MSSVSWARNLRWTLVGELAGKGAIFTSNIMVARELGVAGFGIYSSAQAIAAYIWILADLGVGFYGTREVAKSEEQRRQIISSLFTLRLLAGLFATAIGLTGVTLWFSGVARIAYAIAIIQVLFLALTLDWALRGLQTFRALSSVNVLGGLVLLLGSLTVFSLTIDAQEKIILFLLVWVISQAVIAVASIAVIVSKTEKWIALTFSGLLGHLKFTIYFAISTGLVAAAQYLPILSLNQIIGSEAAGIFSAPYRLVLTIITAVYMLISSTYPILAKCSIANPREFGAQFFKTRNIVLVIALTLSACLMLMADQIVYLLYGAAYSASGPLLLLLSILIPLVSIRAVYGTALLAIGAERMHLVGSVSGFMLWIFVGLPLINSVGVTGAVWACIFSEMAVVVGMIWAFTRISTSKFGIRM